MLGAAVILVDAASKPVDVAMEPTYEDGFSPLKTVLGTISASYAHYKVRLRLLAQESSLMKPVCRKPPLSETRLKPSSHV